MTTVVLVQQGGTGANNASDAVNALGAVANTGGVITGNLNVAATLITQNVLPDANVTYDLGSSTARFKDLWLSNSTIYLGEATISSNGGNIIVPSIQTASGVNVEAQLDTIYTQANNAYAEANLKLNISGGLITGTLNVSQNIIIGGAIAVNGNNYGTAGQVLTSNGSGTPPSWQDAGGGLPEMNIVTATTQAAAVGNHYVLTNASATTVTLPASPSAGDVVWITVANGRVDNVIDRNGNKINSIAENMTIDNAYAGVQLRYANETLGWIFT